MNKITLSFLILLAAGASNVLAQSATVTTTDEKGKVESTTVAQQTAAEKSADSFCLRETGTHLHAIKQDHNESAVECARDPGRSYSREDIARTGATTTADALRRLDPSIH